MSTIILDHVVKVLRGHTVIDDVSMELCSGNIYGIVGSNGSGKTMLLRIISGLILPTSGEVTVDGAVLGKDISFPPDIGILIEKPEFLGHMTGLENLQLLAEIREKVSVGQIREFMDMFDLDPDATKPMRKYSLGMKQKVGIIQAVMEDQNILVLDEAFNALDEKSAGTLRDLLSKYRNDGKLIVVTSHHREDIDLLCDCVYHISNGKVE